MHGAKGDDEVLDGGVHVARVRVGVQGAEGEIKNKDGVRKRGAGDGGKPRVGGGEEETEEGVRKLLLPIFGTQGTLDVSLPFSARHISPSRHVLDGRVIGICRHEAEFLSDARLVEYRSFLHLHPTHFPLEIHTSGLLQPEYEYIEDFHKIRPSVVGSDSFNLPMHKVQQVHRRSSTAMLIEVLPVHPTSGVDSQRVKPNTTEARLFPT